MRLSSALILPVLLVITGCGGDSELIRQAKTQASAEGLGQVEDAYVTESFDDKIVCGRIKDKRYINIAQRVQAIDLPKYAKDINFFWTFCKTDAKGNVKPQQQTVLDNIAKLKDQSHKIESTKVDWHLVEEQSPVDDSKTVMLAVKSLNVIADDLGRKKNRAHLVLRCEENKTELYANFKLFLGMEGISVLHRIDKQKAVTSQWSGGTANDTAFHKQPIPFIKALFDKEQLLLKVTPYSKDSQTVTFNVRGLKESIKPLREACGW